MIRMISGVCALGLLIGTYFICPQSLQDRVNAAISPSPEVLAEVREGLDALTGRFGGPGEVNPARL